MEQAFLKNHPAERHKLCHRPKNTNFACVTSASRVQTMSVRVAWARSADAPTATCQEGTRVPTSGQTTILAQGINYPEVKTGSEVALLITGLFNPTDRAGSTLATRLQGLADAIGGDHLHAFINAGLEREPADLMERDDAAIRAAALLKKAPVLVRVLSKSPVTAWEVTRMSVSSHLPCRPGPPACISSDSTGVYKSQQIGCYRDHGRSCTRCDTRKYWAQFGRLALSLEMVRAYEAHRDAQYRWLVRLCADFKNTPLPAAWPQYGNSSHGWSTYNT